LPEVIEALIAGNVERISLMTGFSFHQTRVISPVTQARKTWSGWTSIRKQYGAGTRGGGFPHFGFHYRPQFVLILLGLHNSDFLSRPFFPAKVQQECSK